MFLRWIHRPFQRPVVHFDTLAGLTSQGQPFYGDFGGVSLQDAQESAEPDEGYCYNDYSTREMSPGAVAHDWLCRNGYEVQAESVLVSNI